MSDFTPSYTINPSMPKDRHSQPIQVLAPYEASAVTLSIAPGNQRIALPAFAQVVEIAASDVCRVRFGDSTVDATVADARVFPAGVGVVAVPPGSTHFAITQYNGSSGIVSVARLY